MRVGPIARLLLLTVSSSFVLVMLSYQLAAQDALNRARQTGERVGQFQRPTEERRLEQSEGTEALGSETAALPSNMEDALYLRERPDRGGDARENAERALLTELLREREGLVVSRREEALELLETFVEEEPDDAPEMPDALLRLAELQWESARGEYLTQFTAWQALEAEHRGREPRPNYRRPMAIYDRLLLRHPDFPRRDLVLYMKAFGLLESGEQSGALDLYRRILAEHPNSRFRPDAHFAIAEASFTGSYDYATALGEYQNVLRYEESGLYDVALFKSAWCLWRLNRTQEAATRFRQVLDLGRDTRGLSSARRRRLQELQGEALDYLIQVFTSDESNTARDVFTFLEDIGGEQYAFRVLERLSDTFMGQSRYERGIEAYKLLLEMDASAADAPRWQQEIASAYALSEDEPKTLEALRALAENYGEGSEWARQQGDPVVVADAQRMAQRSVRRQAVGWHAEGQENEDGSKLEAAAGLYDVFLRNFADAEGAYEVEFYRAEILFHRLERFEEAGAAYLSAAKRNPEGELTRDALYNAIGAFERVREGELDRCGNDAEECEESENDRKFADAIEMYVALYPEDPDLPEILFRQGRLYYDRHIYDPAVRLWGQLLRDFPSSEYAEPAGELILDSFNRAQDYQNIETWARRLKEAPAFSSDASQARLNTLILQAVFKTGEQLAERGAHREAADAYFRAAEEFPQDPRAKQAYYNAGLERQQAGEMSAAVDAYDRLIERFPGDETAARGCWRVAQMFDGIAQFADAARYYETYASQFPDAEKVQEAAYNAVLLHLTAGEYGPAVTSGRRLLRRYPRHGSATEVNFLVARALAQDGRYDEAVTTYRQYIRRSRNADRKMEAMTRLAQVFLESDDDTAADRALTEAVRFGARQRSRLNAGRYFAAQARYLQAERVLARYEAIQIAGDTAGLRDRLQQKSELLREAAVIFADVVEYAVAEYVTAALFQIGRSYELFAEGLRAQPVPEGLSEEEEMSYQDQLSSFIIPMEDQAIQAFEGGYQKALELGIYNRWTAQLHEALTRLNDIQYPPRREVGGDIVSTTPLAPPPALSELRREDEATAEDEDDPEGKR